MLAGRLKPGMVGINEKGKFDPFGTVNTMAQGGSDGAHSWRVLKNGKIATTGAVAGIFYGEVDPQEYLKGKTFFLLETVDPLTDSMLTIMEECHKQLMASGIKRLYGLWKLPMLEGLAAIHGNVTKTGLKPKIGVPEFPICSQAVAYAFWEAGVPIGEALGKEDWSAVLPETFLIEAKETSYYLDYLLNGKRPCYHLKMVEPFAFSGLA